ncbi:MAG TPA: NAD-dependent epimerase/dehydratase family protein [Saprospiraceae bacterium]|nr:NAD-dependent epimerase/dehydratase family protein [Cyclobacteriaceae bacterium]HMX84133.1 NAD-dependent epimerase/dehydratase family protein [Saprospiraceae bacterium]HNG13734.1 NAD-dependent epimerase/dehydratase family protein [Saprospiraceae bacterium]
MIAGKNILVTGGCGFVAGRIAEVFGLYNNVTVMDNMRYWQDMPQVIPPRIVEMWEHDLTDPLSLDHFDIVIHGATVNIIHGMSDMRACVDTNFTQTLAFFDRIPQKTPVLYLSTSSVYGNGVMIPTDEKCRVAPSNVYAMTKLLAEQYLLEHHPNCVIARLSNVYGPRQRPENAYSGVMVKLLTSALWGRPFKVYGDGSQTRDFTYVDDVVAACVALLESGKRGEVYNVGSGVETSVAQLMKYLPENVEVEITEPRSIDNISRRCLDVRKIAMDTGWKPAVSLDHGVAETMLWLKGVM